MTRLKALWPRLMLSLKVSLNSGLLVFFTVLVLSLWASSYTHTHTQNSLTHICKHTDWNVHSEWMWKILTALGKGNSNFTLASRSLAETPVEREKLGVSAQWSDRLLPGNFKDGDDFNTRGSWEVDASGDVQYQVIECQVGVDPAEQNNNNKQTNIKNTIQKQLQKWQSASRRGKQLTDEWVTATVA